LKSSRRLAAQAFDVVADASVVVGYSRFGIEGRRRLFAWPELPDMSGKVVIVTGATAGIGLATAVAVAELGAHVHLLGRDRERALSACAEVLQRASGGVDFDLVDLSDVQAVVALGTRLRERYEVVDVLVHNAGGLTRSYRRSASGTELTVATHLLGPYVLTAMLDACLGASSAATLVTVSSGGMYTQRFDLSKLELSADGYDGVVAYSRSKRAQVLLAEAWAHRYGPEGISSFSMHPGWVDTAGLTAGLPGFSRFAKPLLRSAAEGADTAVWLAAGGPASEARVRGLRPPNSGFFHDRKIRTDHRFPLSSPFQPDDEAKLLDWCHLRSGV
jgi:NAD(P)-dependent dehydrogenase (short-subunit alcohol dehydrogenase family)